VRVEKKAQPTKQTEETGEVTVGKAEKGSGVAIGLYKYASHIPY